MIFEAKFARAERPDAIASNTAAKFVPYFFLLITVLASSLSLTSRLREGFIPADDPVLAHAAERVLQGQRPHVDFHDVYTGALPYLNAAAFKLFGITLLAPRIMLLVCFVPTVAEVWFIASKMVRPATASLVTLLAVVWSVPLYPSPIGSWYNLYFAIAATAALFAYIERGKLGWIFVAGISAGLSILFKIAGLYLLAAGVLFLLFDEQSSDAVGEERRPLIVPILSSAALLVFCGLLVLLIRSHPGAAEYYNFVLPGTALSAFLIRREWRSPHSQGRLLGIARRLVPFLGGTCLVVALFLFPYLAAGQLGLFLHDMSKAASVRILSTYRQSLNPIVAVVSLSIFELIAVDLWLRTRNARVIALLVCSFACAWIGYLCVRLTTFAGWTWLSAAASIPLLTLTAISFLQRRKLSPKRSSQVMLLICVTAMCSLVQFPYYNAMYFSYVAPLVALGMTALITIDGRSEVSIMLPVAVLFIVFPFLVLMPNQIYNKGMTMQPDHLKAFVLPRAYGILGPAQNVDLYERVCAEIAAHGGAGPIYAGPDSAGLYFLTGRENPTPILWEFLAGEDARPDRVLADIRRAAVTVAVIRHSDHNDSGPMPPELLNAIRQQFPYSKNIESFEVRWK
jgi:hypothetical protein